MANPTRTNQPEPDPSRDERLLAFAAGTLSAAEATAVQNIIAGDPEAARTVSRYRLAREAFASDDSTAPSVDAIRRARAVFKPAAKPAGEPGGGWLDAVDRFVARLIFDSRLQPMAVRASGVSERITLTFETDDLEIELQAERLPDDALGHGQGQSQSQPERWRIIGQISARAGGQSAGDRASVALMHGESGRMIAQAQADAHGMFAINAREGSYQLHISAAKGLVVVPQIELA